MIRQIKADKQYSRGVSILRMKPIVDVVQNILSENKDVLWISIGSGNGGIEQYLKNTYQIDIFCVDPNPNSYYTSDKIYKNDFKGTLKTFMEHHKSKQFVGKCVLFLNWTEPNCTYDIDAVSLLNPIEIITIVSAEGSAGSAPFHTFLYASGVPTLGMTGQYVNSMYFAKSVVYAMGTRPLDGSTLIVMLAHLKQKMPVIDKVDTKIQYLPYFEFKDRVKKSPSALQMHLRLEKQVVPMWDYTAVNLIKSGIPTDVEFAEAYIKFRKDILVKFLKLE